MKSPTYFPHVIVSRNADGADASLGIAFKSILTKAILGTCGDPYNGNQAEMLHPSMDHVESSYFQTNREAFLHALSGWPETMTLEIRIMTAPNIHHKPQGKVHIHLFLHAHAPTEEQAREEIIVRYLALMPLLISHFPEIDFAPFIENGASVYERPFFQPTHAIAIHRRTRKINLSEPFPKKIAGLQATPSLIENCGYTIEHRLPWHPSLDDWSRLINLFMNQLDPLQLTIRIRRTSFSDDQQNLLGSNLRLCEHFLAGGEPYQLALKKQVEMIRDTTLEHLSDLTSACFHVGVFLLAGHPIDVSLGYVAGQSITGQISDKRRLFKGEFTVSALTVQEALDIHNYYEQEAFSVTEAAAAFRFPSPPPEDCTGLPVRRCRTGLAMVSYNPVKTEHNITLFSNDHMRSAQPIKVGTTDRMRHTFIVGQTGTGKSTLMESMILQDIRGGQGLAVIDPHGDLIDDLIGKIPPERVEDVILFDILDRDRPLGFNILEWKTIDERDLIIDEIYTTIDHIYNMHLAGGPFFESNLRGMLKLLMGDRQHDDFTPTILNFTMCYLSEDFRKWLGARMDDPANRDFIRELERTRGDHSIQNVATYITSKFSRFTNDTTLMQIIGQERTSFNFEDIMNNGKIFLVKLGKGRFGSQVSALLANMLVSRFKYAAMKRGDLPKEKRKDFYLYVDECHNLPPENFTELLAEARKFRMSLTLATQYTAQMSSQDIRNNLLSAVIGNVGTIIAFRLGQEDARVMSSVFQPHFSALDIIGLPNWQGYARLQQGVDVVPPFSFRTHRDQTVFSEDMAERIKQFSRLNYGTDRATIEKRIREQRRVWQKSDDNDSDDG